MSFNLLSILYYFKIYIGTINNAILLDYNNSLENAYVNSSLQSHKQQKEKQHLDDEDNNETLSDFVVEEQTDSKFLLNSFLTQHSEFSTTKNYSTIAMNNVSPKNSNCQDLNLMSKNNNENTIRHRRRRQSQTSLIIDSNNSAEAIILGTGCFYI